MSYYFVNAKINECDELLCCNSIGKDVCLKLIKHTSDLIIDSIV